MLELVKRSYRIIQNKGIFKFFLILGRFINNRLKKSTYYLFIRYRIVDIIKKKCKKNCYSVNPVSLYEIKPKAEEFVPFLMWLDFNSSHRRDRILGEYELYCLEAIQPFIDKDAIFWEVGAGWGYFSLALADKSASVVGFEPLEERYNLFRKSIDENGFDNVQLCTEKVENLSNFTERYGDPDIILMDIDGWEYSVLKNSEKFLEEGPVLLIEVHTSQIGQDPPPKDKIKPQKVSDLLEDYDYSLNVIGKRGDLQDPYTYHILAQK